MKSEIRLIRVIRGWMSILRVFDLAVDINGRHMQASEISLSAGIVKNNKAMTGRAHRRMVRCWHLIFAAVAGSNCEWLKWSCVK